MHIDKENLIIYTKSLLKKSKTNTKNKTIKNSIKLLLPSKDSVILIIIFCIISTILGILIGFDNNTISLFRNIVKGINNIILVILGINFTGYALFYSMASGETHLNLLSNSTKCKNETTSIFDFYNTYFFGLNTLYLFAILFNFLLHSLINILPTDFVVPIDLLICNIIATILIISYLIIMIWLIIEFSSSIYNLYRCFNINASTEAVKFLEKKEDEL